MRRLALMVLSVLVVPSASADWTQDGGDAGRSGYLRDGGPEWDEVALVVAPPKAEAWRSDLPPLTYGRELLVATQASIVAVNADNGTSRVVAPITDLASAWALSGDLLVVAERGSLVRCDRVCDGSVTPGRLRLLAIPSGEDRARPLAEAGIPNVCEIATTSDAIYTACMTTVQCCVSPDVLELRRLDLDGQPTWTWHEETSRDALASRYLQIEPAGRAFRQIVGLSVAGGLVLVATETSTTSTEAATDYYWEGWVINATTGEPREAATDSPGDLGSRNRFGSGYEGCLVPSGATRNVPSSPVGDDVAWVRKEPRNCPAALSSDPVRAVVETNGNAINVSLRGRDNGARSAITPNSIVVATAGALLELARDGSPRWESAILAGSRSAQLPILADDARVFVAIEPESGGATKLVSFDATTGEATWEHAFEGQTRALVGGPGGIAGIVTNADGSTRLVVVGRTGASLAATAEASDVYPAAGSFVRVDASRSAAGASGAPTKYRAEWGDGQRSPWQASPILEHGYASVGDHVAHVYAANDAGQASAVAVTFHVGREPPQNFLQQQFANENQNRTFFLLGLAGSGLIALFGLVRLRRRRGILARELRAIDHAHEMTRSRPIECERALAERRTRARGLLVDGTIDEGQFAVLDRHIDELSRGVRMRGIEQEFGFLTVGMASLLRGMLADGVIERWERDHFLDVLARDEHLTDEQKARVRARIDEWFARDTGRDAS